MGNCCGSESNENFQGEGRTLGATPANAPPQTDGARASAPPKISAQSKGRTLGSKSQDSSEQESPRDAARRAAEQRAQGSKGKGDLGKRLDEQKKLTQSGYLKQGAQDDLAAREADEAARARNWD